LVVGFEPDDNAPVHAVADWHGPCCSSKVRRNATVTPDQVDDLAAAAPQAILWKVVGGRHVESFKTAPGNTRRNSRPSSVGLVHAFVS